MEPVQLPLNLIEPPKPRLTDGVVGRNGAALKALQEIVMAKAEGFTALLLWGAPGSGKTFWLRAWAHDQPQSVRYIDCDPHASDGAGMSGAQLVQALESLSAQVLEPLGTNARSPCWLIDNIDAADSETTARLFQLYNAAREAGSRIVAAASAAPHRLAMREDLRTRLGQGLIFELHELSDDEKRHALHERAQRLGLELPQEVLNYLLTRLPRNLGRLTQIIDGLNELALSQQRAATLPLLKQLLDSLDATTRPV